MDSRERVLKALKIEIPDRVPFMEFHIDKSIAYKVLNIKVSKPDLNKTDYTGKIVWQPISENKYSLLLLASNLNLDAVGFSARFPSFTPRNYNTISNLNFIGDGIIKTRKDLERINLPDPDDPVIYEPIKKFINEHKSDKALFAAVNLGTSNVLQELGIETFSFLLHDELSLLTELLDLFTDWIAVTVKNLCKLGFDFIWAGNDIAHKTGPIFSPKIFREIFLPRLRKVAENISLPWVFHSDGNILPIIEDLLSLGMDAIHPIEPSAIDIIEFKKNYGKRVCIIGNIDINTLALGSPSEVEEEVKRRIRKVGPGGGYILSSANSIPSYCKPENLLAMSEAVEKYGKYPITI